jgi:hypothetical protein
MQCTLYAVFRVKELLVKISIMGLKHSAYSPEVVGENINHGLETLYLFTRYHCVTQFPSLSHFETMEVIQEVVT